MRGPLSWLAMAGMAVALASILAFLYVKTQEHDTSGYFEDVAMLRQLKQLDARWELDVLKSKMGINAHYDSLVDPLVDLNQLREKLRSDIERQRIAVEVLTPLLDSFRLAIEEKTRLIEHFKSHNSVLRNSIAFLPTAARDIAKAARQTAGAGTESTQFLSDVERVLRDSLEFSQSPSTDMAADIQLKLDRLNSKAFGPESAREGLSVFSSHVRAVLREQPKVNELLNAIALVPTAARIDAVDNILSREQRESEIQAQRYRRYLLTLAAALSALFLYAAISVIRSHAVINRVNRELQAANATLEHKVQQRTSELRAAQSELLTTARQAGMSEIATNVLHNVGNVLNSVNVSAGLIANRVRETKAQGLADAAQLMNQHAATLGDFMTSDDRGKRLPGYLAKLATTLAAERASIAMELGSLTKSVDHIKDIVATQQSYAGAVSVLEPVQIQDLLEDALRMNASSGAQDQVTVVKEMADVPLVLLDRHSLLQILVNLIKNARQAMDGVTDRAQRMILGVEITDVAAERRVSIRVEDNGMGIAPENLPRLFTHGFTTRKSGHGFGLHSCALAAKRMDGTLHAHSDGPGKGATFTLELPLNAAATAA